MAAAREGFRWPKLRSSHATVPPCPQPSPRGRAPAPRRDRPGPHIRAHANHLSGSPKPSCSRRRKKPPSRPVEGDAEFSWPRATALRHHALMTVWPSRTGDGVPSPELVAACARLGLLPIEKVPLRAAHWLVAGHDGEHVVQLAGLHGDDPHEVRDALPGALLDCGVQLPDSDLAAATVAFAHLARMHLGGLAGPQWIGQKVEEALISTGYPQPIIALPLGRLYYVDDEWDAGWGRTNEELAQFVRTHARTNCATARQPHSHSRRRA
jgi:hypothetical protein